MKEGSGRNETSSDLEAFLLKLVDELGNPDPERVEKIVSTVRARLNSDDEWGRREKVVDRMGDLLDEIDALARENGNKESETI